MTMKAITSWDGTRNNYGVEDSDGGTWWPCDSTQEQIQESPHPKKQVVEICKNSPREGEWSS